MRKRLSRLAVVDTVTGEVLADQDVVVKKRSVYQEGWMRHFMEAKKKLVVEHPELKWEALRVLAYVEMCLGYNTNEVPSTGEVAEALGFTQSTVSRAYRKLVELDVLEKRRMRYFLSPFIGWRGGDKAYNDFYRDWIMRRDTRRIDRIEEVVGELARKVAADELGRVLEEASL